MRVGDSVWYCKRTGESEYAEPIEIKTALMHFTVMGKSGYLDIQEYGENINNYLNDYKNATPEEINKRKTYTDNKRKIYCSTTGECFESINDACRSYGVHSSGVVNCCKGKISNTKGYIFKQEEIYRIIIGSSNMTLNAMTQNREWNTKIVAMETGAVVRDILNEFETLASQILSAPKLKALITFSPS